MRLESDKKIFNHFLDALMYKEIFISHKLRAQCFYQKVLLIDTSKKHKNKIYKWLKIYSSNLPFNTKLSTL